MTSPDPSLENIISSLTELKQLADERGLNDIGDLIGRTLAAAEIAAQRDQAQAKLIQSARMEVLGELATTVAHELNQPLNVIRLAAESSMERIEAGDEDLGNFQAKLARISRQTVRAADIIDHMQIFGRIRDDVPCEFDPREAVEDALDMVREQMRLHSVELCVKMPATCPMVWGHSAQFQQVIFNLVSNAFESMQDHNKVLCRKRITIQIVDRSTEDELDIVLEDTGGGRC